MFLLSKLLPLLVLPLGVTLLLLTFAVTALSLGLAAPLVIETPLMWLSKAATWQMAHDLGEKSGIADGGDKLVNLIIEHTHTCYLGDRVHRHAWGWGCGSCPACELRARGYARWVDARASAAWSAKFA